MKKIEGLSQKEVEILEEKGLKNYNTDVKTKSIKLIVLTNFFTLFNLLNFALGVAVFFTGSYKNLLFLGIIFCNTIISTYQEIRSKIVIDRLSLLKENNVTVVRDGVEKKIGMYDLVLGDVVKLNSSNQVPTDVELLEGEVLVNESLLTGEEELIHKNKGDELYSGSFIVSGFCYAKAIHVGKDNYASKISMEAKYIKKVNSEILNFINKIIKYISISIIPIGILLFLNQIKTETLNEAIMSTVAALIGMIPEGLVLLTSTVLAVSVIRLAKHKVLVQDLYCIETLARVDTICLDKTGTITEGKMAVSDIVALNGTKKSDITDALGLMSFHMQDDNQTMKAIGDMYARKNDYKVLKIVHFSSKTKWSGISFEKESYVIGAPDILIDDVSKIKEINKYSSNRVLLLGKTTKKLTNNLPKDIKPMALIIINDEVRKTAKSTLQFFKKQGVDIKLISGDNPKTVMNVAERVGLKNLKYIDMSKNDLPIIDIANKYNVFGRVKPDQKKEIILALKSKGHTVAMTGDGINDVLALKEADCSVAMNSGSDAARNVSQIVLLDSDFASMPKVVAEGRRSINNIQRSSSLFLCKTIYASMLALIFMVLGMSYPFIPIHLTLISMVTIGIPSFVLALEPNNDRIKGKIILNVLKNSLPTALTVVSNIIIIMILPSFIKLTQAEVSTLCVIMTALTGFMLLYKISVPFNRIRKILFITLLVLFICEIVFLRRLFSLVILTPFLIILIAGLLAIAGILFNFFYKMIRKISLKIKFD